MSIAAHPGRYVGLTLTTPAVSLPTALDGQHELLLSNRSNTQFTYRHSSRHSSSYRGHSYSSPSLSPELSEMISACQKEAQRSVRLFEVTWMEESCRRDCAPGRGGCQRRWRMVTGSGPAKMRGYSAAYARSNPLSSRRTSGAFDKKKKAITLSETYSGCRSRSWTMR